jgi:hypothetical protein
VSLPLAATAVDNGKVIIFVALVALPIAALAFAGAGRALKDLGKGRFAIERELPAPRILGPTPAVSPAVREAEVRQMLEAKSYRRELRGEAPLDIEAELEQMLAAPDPAVASGMDAQLREEVRQLVVARNERRMRKGEEPLDVETEIRRQLSDLESLGQ